MNKSRRESIKKMFLGSLGIMGLANLSYDESQDFYKQIQNKNPDENFWKFVRNQFLLTQKRVYLNNGTIGPSPFQVNQAIKKKLDFLDEHAEYRGWHETRKDFAKFINADENEIILTQNTTHGNNILASAFPIEKNDEVIITTHEHSGNAAPWINQAHYKGFQLKAFQPKKTATEVLNQIKNLISKKTKAITLPHISCTTGQVFPIEEIANLARENKIYFLVDGAHGAGSTALDIKKINCDAYATCCHKWLLGANGSGFLFIKKELIPELNPQYVDGYNFKKWEIIEKGIDFEIEKNSPKRFEFGTLNAASFQGSAEATRFMDAIGIKKIEKRTRHLTKYLQEKLLKINHIEMLSPTEKISRSMMLAFRPKNIDYKSFAKLASKNKFRIRQLPEANLNAIRVSTHIYNSKEELDAFVDFVKTT